MRIPSLGLATLASAALGLAVLALAPHAATQAQAQRYCAGGSCDFDERTGRYREPVARVGRPLCTDGFRSYECDGPGDHDGEIGLGPLPSPDIRGPIYRIPEEDYRRPRVRHPRRHARHGVHRKLRRHHRRAHRRVLRQRHYGERRSFKRRSSQRWGHKRYRHGEWGPHRYANRTRFCRIEKRGHGWHAKKVRRCIYVRNDLLGVYEGGGWHRW